MVRGASQLHWVCWALLSAALGAAACQPKVTDYQVNVVTSSCLAPAPLEGVTHLKLRVLGDGMSTPLETIALASERTLSLPEVPSGDRRVVEVRAYAGDPADSGRIVSLGRSLPFNVPSTPSSPSEPVVVNVFLRRVNSFSKPASISQCANGSCVPSCTQMSTPRAGHTASLLKDGRVFIAGGYTLASVPTTGAPRWERTATERTEIFDPSTGEFTDGPLLRLAVAGGGGFYAKPLAFHTATAVPNGQVYLWGGEIYPSGNDQGSPAQPRRDVIVYDVGTNQISGLANCEPRAGHRAVLDDTGLHLFIIGGTGTDKVEWFDIPSNQVRVVPGLSFRSVGLSAAPVQAGRYVAVAGGVDGTRVRGEVAFFSYDGTTFIQEATALSLAEPRRAAAAATVGQGNDMLLLGGYTDVTAIAPTASSSTVRTKDSLAVTEGPAIQKRGDICAALLPDGRVLAIGGRTVDRAGGPARSDPTVEMIYPQPDGTAVSLGAVPLPIGRYYHTCTTLSDGSVLVLGGVREGSATSLEALGDAVIFTPEPLDQ